MIIRMTVQDKEFTPVIEDFCSALISDTSIEAYTDFATIRKILSANKCRNLAVHEKVFICKEVESAWNTYVRKHYAADTVEYLENRLQVYIWFRMFDRQEDHKFVYYFVANNKYIVQ